MSNVTHLDEYRRVKAIEAENKRRKIEWMEEFMAWWSVPDLKVHPYNQDGD